MNRAIGPLVRLRFIQTSVRRSFCCTYTSLKYFNSFYLTNRFAWRSCHSPSIATVTRRFLSSNSESASSVTTLIPEGDCPGCGAPFQTHDPNIPGYYVERKKNNLGSDAQHQRQRKRSNNSLSDAEFQAAVEALDPELRALLEQGGEIQTTISGQTDKNDLSHQKQSINSVTASTTADETKEDPSKPEICQRCYSLKHHNQITTETSPAFLRSTQQYGSLEFLKTKRSPLIVVVLDISDLPFSLGSQLSNLVRDNPSSRVLIAGNKVDMIPQRARRHEQRIRDWIVQYLKQQGFPTQQIKGVSLVSARKGWGILNLLRRIDEERLPTDDVYLVGSTNVGKSALVNNILSQRASKDRRQLYQITSSPIPGTTMGTLRIPLHALHMGSSSSHSDSRRLIERDHYLIDTPGVVNDQQLIHLMTFKEQKKLMRHGEFKPITFRLEAGRTLLLDSFIRIDVVETSNPVLFTLFTPIIPHITKTLKLTGKKSSLEPIQQLISVQGVHKSRAAVDFAFASIGWIAVAGLFDKAKFRIWLPHELNPAEAFAIREPAMLPFEYQGVIRKFFGSGDRARK